VHRKATWFCVNPRRCRRTKLWQRGNSRYVAQVGISCLQAVLVFLWVPVLTKPFVRPLIFQFPTRMWANAQRDGRPAEYRWRPLFNAAKFGWRPLLECRAVTLPRRESRWNWKECPKLANRFQPLVAHRCLTVFMRLLIHASTAKIQADKVVRWRQNGDFCVLY